MPSSSESSPPPFDLGTLSAGQRLLCETLTGRGYEVLSSLATAYRKTKPPEPIAISFLHSPRFNASAYHGHIDIHIASVLLLNAFFEKLLSSSAVVPELPHARNEARTWRTPFIRDLRSPSIDTQLDITLDPGRQTVALVLQDFCASFIMLHEVAHHVCGHCRSVAHYFDESQIHEFFGAQRVPARGRYLRTAWEYDADITAAVVLCQYVHHFIGGKKSPQMAAAFAFLAGDMARLLGLVTAALFAMFIYLAQMEYSMQVRSYHPHPMLRIKYIAQTFLHRCAADYGLDGEKIYEWQMHYMEQFAAELQRTGFFDLNAFEAAFSAAPMQVTELSSIAGRLRGSCKRWSWFPIASWATLHHP